MTSELSLVATGKGSNIMCGDQSDHVLQHWTVDISIDEHEGLTRAKARLRWRKRNWWVLAWQGSIRPTATSPRSAMNSRSPEPCPTWGKRMLKVSTHDIEAVTHQPARLLY